VVRRRQKHFECTTAQLSAGALINPNTKCILGLAGMTYCLRDIGNGDEGRSFISLRYLSQMQTTSKA